MNVMSSTAEAHREVDVVTDALRHDVIVFLPRPVDARRPQHDIVEVVADGVEKLLSHELALAVGGVRPWRVAFFYLLIGLLLHFDRSEDAQTAHVDEAFEWHVELEDRVDKILCALVVDLEEVVSVQTFRHACCMNDIVKVVSAQLFNECVLRGEVEVDEMDTLVLQIAPRTGATHPRPRLKTAPERFFHDKTANKAAGTGY